MTRRLAALALLALPLAPWAPDRAQALETSAGQIAFTPVVTGLQMPWGFDFLPDGTILVTEKSGRLLSFAGGEAKTLTGLPEIARMGQGGLLDVMVPRDFAETREIFLSYAKPQGSGAGTALASARLPEGATALQDLRLLFEMTPGGRRGQHFGSRIVEAADGRIFLTIGDRGARDLAQDLSRHNGTVIRINRDGSVPSDNPFRDHATARPEIWSYGHRNAQGAALAPDGTLWLTEHGARGGDEVNRITPGANYGWPVIAYGVNYNGSTIGSGTQAPGMVQPVSYWDPSMAPSGLGFYTGEALPEWQGDAFAGSLKFDYIARLSGDPLTEVEQISAPETARVRDVGSGPQGHLWFLSEDNGTLYRIDAAE